MKILVLDTETVSETEKFGGKNYVFDLGYVVWDTKTRSAVGKYQMLIKEVYNNPDLMKNYVFGQERLKEAYLTQNIPQGTCAEAFEQLSQVVKNHEVERIAAYNNRFDIDSIVTTVEKYGSDFNVNKYQWIDLYHMACQALAGNESFVSFCLEHERVSEKGNINSNAETVYAFIKNKGDYVEEHTALEDAIIEAQICQWVLDWEEKKGIKLKTNHYGWSWKLVQPPKEK